MVIRAALGFIAGALVGAVLGFLFAYGITMLFLYTLLVAVRLIW
jgi:F0F1-type ATP synthase assembly protein I